MRIWLLSLLLMAFLGSGNGATGAPLEAYARLPSIENVAVSPAGRTIALIATNGLQRTIIVRDLESGQTTLRGAVGEHKIRDLKWAGEQHLIVVASIAKDDLALVNGYREWFFGSLIDLNTKKIKPLMAKSTADSGAILGPPEVRINDGQQAVFVPGLVLSGGKGLNSLFRVDLRNGTNRIVEKGAPDSVSWVIDSRGQPVAQEVIRGREWSVIARSESGWRTLLSLPWDIDRPYLVGLGRDDASLIYGVPDGKGDWSWKEIRLDGRPAAEFPFGPGTPRPIFGAGDGRLIGYRKLVGDDYRYSYFDPADQSAWDTVQATFPEDRVHLVSGSADRRKAVVLVDPPRNGPVYAFVDLRTRRAEWLGASYAGLAPEDIGSRERVQFNAADGLPLSGFLTLPHSRRPQDLPMVVLVHGGPASRDTPGFDWWAQAVASRGYAVLQVNYRGSTVTGELMTSGYGQWGAKMQTDLSDGVRALAARGVIDPKRVCIMGASYGGYAALAGATLDRGVYRCAVAISAPADLRRLIVDARTFGRGATRYWDRFMGVSGADDPKLERLSPLWNAAKADIPILLIHGTHDTVVPVEQSRAMADALRKAGKTPEVLIQEGEDHWLSGGATRLEMVNASMTFIERHNPP
ncbi:MAG: S9 family peptidase [Phenylobacterium sp.]|uniref:alpha/beta hydrolase family protein n=1 Tax=Phenylobacterium sp. TaxID=1871053 RepID=UPI0025E24FC8|nr:S9 family peptidase [Phenylobacterium sp.]MCA6267596.1 S9 family peptidase [Phenylobacterium sp.]